MNCTGKVSTILLIVLVIIWTTIEMFKWEALPPTRTIIVFTICILIPIILGLIFKRIFRNSHNPGKLQWIPNFVNIIWILFITILIQGAFESINNPSNDFKKVKEQIRIEKSVAKWIENNAKHPESYQSIEFSDYIETIKGFTEKDKFNTIADYIKSDNFGNRAMADIQYAYYFIKHIHVLKNKSDKLDTITAYFQLSPLLEVRNVRTANEYENPHTTETGYEWRQLYGNSNKNLELELNGNTSKNYLFRLFDETGNFQELIPYSNGKINGVYYYIRPAGGLGAVLTYKNGIRNGLTLEICQNKTLGFKGTCINGEFYGLSTWWHCNGQKSEEGIRLNGIKVGVWKYWDEQGNLTEVKNYGNKQIIP
jgi:antitoxin component YwqK of YwqJK toxin-antitoxin module